MSEKTGLTARETVLMEAILEAVADFATTSRTHRRIAVRAFLVIRPENPTACGGCAQRAGLPQPPLFLLPAASLLGLRPARALT